MIEMKKILLNLSKSFPKSIAKKYHDHVGLMTGKMPGKINKVFLCLDLDWEVLPEVIKFKPDVIITHHPFIFGTKYRVFKYDLRKKELCEKIDSLGIPVYSFHTNFDEGKGGINDSLARKLGLKNIYAPIKEPMMRIGNLEKSMDINEFASFVKESFNVDYALLINSGNKKISKVGMIGGGGSRMYKTAIDEGCDIYISGDTPHYVRRDVVNLKFNYLDVPHEVENVFMEAMKNILLSIDSSLNIKAVVHEKMPTVIR